MESAPPALILASRRRALTGSSRGLSRAYVRGELVRVRTGVYYSKPAWLALKAWERYAATAAAVAESDPAVDFCYLTALRAWRLPSPTVPDYIHILTPSPHKAGKLPPTTRAARDPKTGRTGLEDVRGYALSRHRWQSDVVGTRGFGVTSLVQTVMDCVGRPELPESVAIMDAVLGNRRKEGEGLTRVDVQHAAAGLASAAKRRRVLEVLELADAAAESVGESRSRALLHVLGLPAPVLQHSYTVVRWDWKAVTDPEVLRRKLEAAGVSTQKSPPRGLIPRALPGEWTT